MKKKIAIFFSCIVIFVFAYILLLILKVPPFILINDNVEYCYSKNFHLSDSSTTDKEIVNLKYMKNLTSLFLLTPKITNIDFLNNMDDLYSLSLEAFEIEDWSPLQHCTNLENLYLWHTGLQDLSVLRSNTSLKILDLESGNPVENITDLKYLVQLEVLCLSSKNLTDVSSLSGLINLKYLSITNSNISDVSSLSNCLNLIELDLSGNKFLEDISPIADLYNLESINISHTSVENYDTLLKLPNLKKITIDSGLMSETQMGELREKGLEIFIASN